MKQQAMVVLVNEMDEAVGSMEKLEAHQKGLLHRAFSVFIFDENGNMLLQRRAAGKYHSPGLWTNACCSHPAPGERVEDAARRRLKEELGFVTDLEKRFHFIYEAKFENGLTEHEFDHVFTGTWPGNLEPDPAEVSEVAFRHMDWLKNDLNQHPERYTVWFRIAFDQIWRQSEWQKRPVPPSA